MLLEGHPYSELFPKMTGEEFDDLVADVRKRGIETPIVVLDGKVLDGRHRMYAAEFANKTCPTIEYDGDDPLGYVVSMNMHRRSLSPSQRAAIAAEISKDSTRGGDRSKPHVSVLAKPTVVEAAKQMNVHPNSVQAARNVMQSSPDLHEAVKQGNVSVADAKAILPHPPEVRQKAVEAKVSGETRTAAKYIEQQSPPTPSTPLPLQNAPPSFKKPTPEDEPSMPFGQWTRQQLIEEVTTLRSAAMYNPDELALSNQITNLEEEKQLLIDETSPDAKKRLQMMTALQAERDALRSQLEQLQHSLSECRERYANLDRRHKRLLRAGNDPAGVPEF